MDILKGLYLSDDYDFFRWVVHFYAAIKSDVDMFLKFFEPDSVKRIPFLMQRLKSIFVIYTAESAGSLHLLRYTSIFIRQYMVDVLFFVTCSLHYFFYVVVILRV